MRKLDCKTVEVDKMTERLKNYAARHIPSKAIPVQLWMIEKARLCSIARVFALAWITNGMRFSTISSIHIDTAISLGENWITTQSQVKTLLGIVRCRGPRT
jgi:hypothetical protein